MINSRAQFTASKASGFILWQGASAIDGAPIVAIVTGLGGKSRNPKTGAMVQTWIIRSDQHPVEALKTGADISICGDCIHRPDAESGKRSCYVNIMGPSSVYRAFLAGRYPLVSLALAAELCAGSAVRIGSYGDPMAAPLAIWENLTARAIAWTGYSHQWRKLAGNPLAANSWAKLVMASADSALDGEAARDIGFRTFRVTAEPFQNIRGLESVCPASKEKGRVAVCADCRACMGTSSKARASIQIAQH